MKQTAVEWYGLQIGILISKFFNNEISKSEVHFKRIEIEEQAKEMEEQQRDDLAIGFGACLIELLNDSETKTETMKELLEIYKK